MLQYICWWSGHVVGATVSMVSPGIIIIVLLACGVQHHTFCARVRSACAVHSLCMYVVRVQYTLCARVRSACAVLLCACT